MPENSNDRPSGYYKDGKWHNSDGSSYDVGTDWSIMRGAEDKDGNIVSIYAPNDADKDNDLPDTLFGIPIKLSNEPILTPNVDDNDSIIEFGDLSSYGEVKFTFEMTHEEFGEMMEILNLNDSIDAFLGYQCRMCREVFTEEFFDNGGNIMWDGYGWSHQHCTFSDN